MTYLIQHDFNGGFPYYVRLRDNYFEEIYNPSFATEFNTVKEAKDWIDTYSSMADHSKVVESSDAIKKYKIWEEGGTIRRVLSYINLEESKPYKGESLNEVIDWWIYYDNNDSKIKYEHYLTWPKVYSMSKHLWDVESYYSSDYKELYTTFRIFTNRNGVFEDFENELNLVIDKVTYKDEDDYLIFPVFDHFLSEYGNSVSLLIHSESKKVKISGKYSYHNADFNSLEDAFNYLKKERFYE